MNPTLILNIDIIERKHIVIKARGENKLWIVFDSEKVVTLF